MKAIKRLFLTLFIVIAFTTPTYALNLSVGPTNAWKVYYYLRSTGYSKAAAAGVLGNLIYESGGTTNLVLNAVEYGSGAGIGMCQWTGPRRNTFVSYCNYRGVGWPNTNLEVQLEFMLKELRGDYGTTWCLGSGYSGEYNMSLASYKRLSDVFFATDVFCAMFERPSIPNLPARRARAYYFFYYDKGIPKPQKIKYDTSLSKKVIEVEVASLLAEKPAEENEDTGRTILDGIYRIKWKKDDQYEIGITGNSDRAGAGVSLRNAGEEESAYSEFEITYAGDGYYRIRSTGSGLAVKVNGTNQSGAKLIQGSVDGKKNQLFQIVLTKKKGYRLIPKSAQDCCVDLKGGKEGEGISIVLSEKKKNSTGYWNLVFCSEIPSPIMLEEKNTQTIRASSCSKTIGSKAFSLKASTSGDGTLTYITDDPEVATVSKSGKITVKGVGTARITITASETEICHSAEKTIVVSVLPKPTELTALKNSGKKKLKVTWKFSTESDGYEIEVSSKKTFEDAAIYTVSKNQTVSKTIPAQKGKTYYVRVRTVQNGMKSEWSAAEKMKKS